MVIFNFQLKSSNNAIRACAYLGASLFNLPVHLLSGRASDFSQNLGDIPVIVPRTPAKHTSQVVPCPQGQNRHRAFCVKTQAVNGGEHPRHSSVPTTNQDSELREGGKGLQPRKEEESHQLDMRSFHKDLVMKNERRANPFSGPPAVMSKTWTGFIILLK